MTARPITQPDATGCADDNATGITDNFSEFPRGCQYADEDCDDAAEPRSNYCLHHQRAMQIQHAADDSE